jgi:hypothetical protein
MSPVEDIHAAIAFLNANRHLLPRGVLSTVVKALGITGFLLSSEQLSPLLGPAAYHAHRHETFRELARFVQEDPAQ